MKQGYVRNWGYLGPGDFYGDLAITEGQTFSGFAAGVLVPDRRDPKPVGHVANAKTFPFPVRYLTVAAPLASCEDEVREKARQLELEGCRFIVSAGGELGLYQNVVAEEVDLPVYMTPLIQLPWIRAGLKSSETVLIVSDLTQQQAERVFERCAVSKESYDDCLFFRANYREMTGESALDSMIRRRVVEKNHIRAVLLDTQIFAGLPVRERLGVAVWDMGRLMRYVERAARQRPRYGFL